MNSREFFLIGHGKLKDSEHVFGLKDLCDVLKNLMAVGTVSLTSFLLFVDPALSSDPKPIHQFSWMGLISTILLLPILIALLLQLHLIVSNTPLSFKSSIPDVFITLFIFLGITLGIASVFIIALQGIY